MSWLFSQALVEAFSEDICSDGEPSVQSNGNPTQQAYLSQDKMTKFSRLSRFGMTYKPLTDTLGEELLTSFRGVFLARTYQQLDEVLVSQENDQVCGNTWQGSLAKYDQNTHSWKTAQCSLFEDLELSLETFPKWGMTVNGELYLQQTLVQTIEETESGLWPTPNTLEGLKPKKIERIMEYNQKARPGRSYASMNLREQVVYGKQPIWPTPVVRDYKDSGSQAALIRARDKRDSPGLGLLVGAENGGSLNPTWVEWLMGWPLGWTDLKPLETDKSLSVLLQPGNCLHKETND